MMFALNQFKKKNTIYTEILNFCYVYILRWFEMISINCSVAVVEMCPVPLFL